MVIVSKQRIKELTTHLKKKSELKNIDDMYVEDCIMEAVQDDKDMKTLLASDEPYDRLQKKKTAKDFLKKVRSDLNVTYGMFKTAQSKKVPKLLEQLSDTLASHDAFSKESIELHKKILKTHTSTYERLPFYKEIYEELWETTGKPASILDLGAGLNPLSYVFMNINNLTYTAIELSEDDCTELNEYFNIMEGHSGLQGTTSHLNLLHVKNKFPQTDVCFMFKTLDVLEGVKMKVRENIFKHITSNWIVVSFATETINKKQIHSDRTWFLNFLQHNKYKYKVKEWKNEVFYVMKKH